MLCYGVGIGSRIRKFCEMGVGFGNFGKVGVGHFTSDSVTLIKKQGIFLIGFWFTDLLNTFMDP